MENQSSRHVSFLKAPQRNHYTAILPIRHLVLLKDCLENTKIYIVSYFVVVNNDNPVEQMYDLNIFLGHVCLYIMQVTDNPGCPDANPLPGLMYNYNLDPVLILSLETGFVLLSLRLIGSNFSIARRLYIQVYFFFIYTVHFHFCVYVGVTGN